MHALYIGIGKCRLPPFRKGVSGVFGIFIFLGSAGVALLGWRILYAGEGRKGKERGNRDGCLSLVEREGVEREGVEREW